MIIFLHTSVSRQNIMQHKTNCRKILCSTKQITPKQPHSPVFYTSSDLMENGSFQIISSKELSSNESQTNKIIKEENIVKGELSQEISQIKTDLENHKCSNILKKNGQTDSYTPDLIIGTNISTRILKEFGSQLMFNNEVANEPKQRASKSEIRTRDVYRPSLSRNLNI